ncbi:MAG: hypothetical protein V4635_17845 [Bacteroidota bacterium]
MNTTINNKLKLLLGINVLVFKIVMVLALSGFFSNELRSANTHPIEVDSLTCLEIEGRMLCPDKGPKPDYIVELINKDGSIDTVVLKNKNKFKFSLNRNSNYGIRISRSGYVSKLISVNTEINAESEGIHRLMFETSLLKQEALVHLNKEAADLPIAIIHFDSENDCFMYNKKYTAAIKKEMRRTGAVSKTTAYITTESKTRAKTYTE